ncbi:EGF-like domain protein (macronuclear) [Tetrahymena thermophila SB210]|uniref:EGF-like domain protein n=1 Tax=Tetrahymena thermophila (strain SB210) TaxID=312017 RepID=I7MI93_TETTS|nr:EGF-like domain protein [Tetrahymena thermophila SB210]EAS04000.3 EGF-like domain protein [Tetrahymena thermophila SB210]|eukprot:XP_001024245.3 EGF-like domain protein [Tetrahymena thermophila SB210]
MWIIILSTTLTVLLVYGQQLKTFTTTKSVLEMCYVEVNAGAQNTNYIAQLFSDKTMGLLSIQDATTTLQIDTSQSNLGALTILKMDCLETPIGYQILFLLNGAAIPKIGTLYNDGSNNIYLSTLKTMPYAFVSYYYKRLSDTIYTWDGTTVNVETINIFSLAQGANIVFTITPTVFYISNNKKYYFVQDKATTSALVYGVSSLAAAIYSSAPYTNQILKVGEYNYQGSTCYTIVDNTKKATTLTPNGVALTEGKDFTGITDYEYSYGSQLLQFEQNGKVVNVDFTILPAAQTQKAIYSLASFPSPNFVNLQKRVIAFYQSHSGQILILNSQCNKKCSSCTLNNQFTCLTCNIFDNRQLIGGQCVCNSGFIDTDQDFCFPCQDPFCQSCFDTVQNSCYSCLPGMYLTQQNICSCPDGYYFDTSSSTCKVCSPGCEVCSSSTICTKCYSSNYNLNANKCDCNNGFYPDPSTQLCLPCHQSCSTCSGPLVTTCITCKDATQVVFKGTCQCKLLNQFLDKTFTCINCDPSCQSCAGISTYCLTCDPSANRQLTQNNQCACLPGFYDNSGTCTSCGVPFCQTCAAAGTCTVCQTLNGFSLTFQNGKCNCPSGYYLDLNIGTCVRCHYSCQTCHGPSNINCDTCDPTANRDPVTVDFKCNCSNQHFEINQYCAPCSSNCNGCLQLPNNCINCKSGYHLAYQPTYLINQCFCNDGTYYDSSTDNCDPCTPANLCQTCSSSSQCLTCLPNASLGPSKQCSCNLGFYLNANQCSPCTWTTPPADCISQAIQLFRDPSNGYSCIVGYYLDAGSGLCLKCYQSCITCHGPLQTDCDCHETCLTCVGPYPYQCTSCHNNFIALSGGTEGYCNQCQSGYFLKDGVCQQCDPNCQECLYSSTYCTFCKNYQTLLTNKTCGCLPGYFDDTTQCAQNTCHAGDNCALCSSTNPSSCITCNTNNNFTLQNGVCICIYGYGLDAGNCVKCHPLCGMCDPSDYSKCLTCNSEQNRALSNNLCKCQNGFTGPDTTIDPTQFICQQCYYSCQTCTATGYGNCSSCGLNRDNTNHNCACNTNFYDLGNMNSCIECPSGTYSSAASFSYCQPCDPSCKECSGNATTCTKCQLAYNRIFDGSTNTCNCMKGYAVQNQDPYYCQPCPYFCTDCQSSLNNVTQKFDVTCNQCSDTNRQLPHCDCNTGYYNVPGDSNCKKCHYSCDQCIGPGINDCLSCPTGRISYYPSKNMGFQCICPSNQYDKIGDPTCYDCKISCLTCKGPNDNDCLTCPDPNMQLVNGQCQCKTGYYSPTDNQCLPCHHSCATCTGTSDHECLTCSDTTRIYDIATKTCPCIPNYYDNSPSPICSQCHYTCQSCHGNQKTDCIACAANRIFDGSNLCVCPPDTQAPEGQPICTQCHYSCQTCQGPLATDCLTCADINRTLTVIPPNLFGSCPCNSKYYDDQKSSICIQCHQSCLTCFGSNPYQCQTCDLLSGGVTTNRSSKIPFCPCNNYYTESPNSAYSAVCLLCGGYCSACDSTDINICHACLDSDNRILVGQDCVCKQGYYQVNSMKVCQPCPKNCVTCVADATSGKPLCQSCNTKENRDVGTNQQCQCKQMYYLLNDPGTGICQPCDPKCASCDPLNGNCITCIVNRSSPPACTCTPPLIQDSVNYPNCIQCDHSCKYNCFGPSPFQCLNPCDLNSDALLNPLNRQFNPFLNSCPCKPGYSEDVTLPNNPKCMPCSYTCQTCSAANDANSCSSCSSSNNRVLVGSTCNCMDGYYDNGNSSVCLNCNYTCKTCSYNQFQTPQLQCLSCDPDNYRYLSNGSCLCKTGYYDDGNSPVCQKCQQSCLSCIQPNICKTCDSVQKRILDPISLTCICQDGTFENANKVCQACDLSCQTCINNTNTGCTSCQSSYQRAFKLILSNPYSGSCNCIDGYYQSPNNQVCLPCHYSCYSCQGPLQTDCIKCQISRTYNIATSLCSCPSNKYDVFGITQCQDCPYYCKTCSAADTTKCSTCDPAQQRQMNALTGYCDCNQGFYDDGSPVCKPCFQNCLTCRGPNQYDCTLCDSSKNRILQNGICVCMIGYYNINGQVACGQCDQSCYTCQDNSNGGPNQCSSCSLQQFRQQQGNYCLCINGYFQDPVSKLCVQCDQTCATCASITTCATCNSSQFRVLNPTSQLCDCMSGYYTSGTQTCQPCDRTCKTCSGSGPNQCLTCDATQNRQYYTNGGNSSCQCLDNYYDLPPNSACSKCHYSCKNCSGSNRNQCTACDPATSRTLTASQCVCPSNLFDILDTPICQQCHYSCVTCTDNTPSGCVTCPAGRNLVNTQCLCQEGNIDDPVQQKCLSCHYSCATCSVANGSSSTCLTCNPAYFRSLVNNQCACNPGYYDDGSHVLCSQCDPTCRTCSGPGSSSCQSCDATLFRTLNASNQCVCMNGYFLSAGTCQKCDDNCKTCANTSTNCNSCSSLMKLVGNQCFCENGYFAQGSSCIQCDITCSTCNGPTAGDCLTCDAQDFRLCNQCTDLSQTNCQLCTPAQQAPNVKKFCRCQNRYFSQQGLSQCYPCSYQCLTCLGPNSCTSCDSVGDLRVLQGTQCQCILGTYDAGISTCQPCHYSCQSCVQDSQFDCLSCLSGQYRQYNSQSKQCACQSGFYDSGQKVCKQCDPTCFTCSGPSNTNCLSCSSAQNYREFNPLQGTCNCMSGYYNDPIQSRCLPCHYSCATCSGSGPNSCLTCRQTDFRTFDSGKCGCNDGYYDNNTSQCASCHFSCKNCIGSLQTQCTQCDAANSLRQFNSQTSTCDCMGGYYSLLGLQQCQSCHYTCLTCRGPNPNQCTACLASAKRFMQIDNTCACDSGYYEIASPQNSNIKICVPCSPTCYICSTFNQCTGCNQSDYRSLNIVTQQCECINGYYEVRQQSGTLSSCQVCNTAANRVVSNDKLSCVCKPGFFEDPSSSNCMPCPISCAECLNSKQCTSCSSSQFRIFSNYQCIPMQGYFDTGQAIAQKCSQQCKNCVNFATNCISCRTEDGYTMSKDQTCVCQEGYQEVADVDTGITVCRSPQSLAQKSANQDNVMWFYIFLCISGLLALIIIVYLGRRFCMKSEDPQNNPRIHALDISEQDIFNQRPEETLQQLENDNKNLPKIEQAQDYNFAQKKNVQNQTISPGGGDQIV